MAVPRNFAVENHFVDRQGGNGSGNMREMLWKPVAREQTHIAAAFVRQEPNPIELALEEPVVAAEPILGQRRGHRLEPVWHLRGRRHRSMLPITEAVRVDRCRMEGSRRY